MIKSTFEQLLLFIVFGVGIMFMVNVITSRISTYESHLHSKIGKTYIINKDTLTVAGYSFMDKTLILSNGLTINETLVE